MNNKKGFVYLLQSKSNNKLFKIGCSANITQRLKTLQNTSAGGIKLIYLFEVADRYEEEAYLKDFFKSHNINGEWYDLISVCHGIISFTILAAIGNMYKKYLIFGKENLNKFKKIIKEKGHQIKIVQ
jgi:predicted GIY-YIG superfamily endonuclease